MVSVFGLTAISANLAAWKRRRKFISPDRLTEVPVV